MAQINSYTGEVVSEVTEIEERDDEFVIHIEDAVLDAIGLKPDQSIVLKGMIGDKSLTIEPAKKP
ncbi:hypothetical protein [Natrinema gelatinilyticum]|uniref:hypothetical protein n=1 Tax=Natrinema gelatinilyticum TaxID=2961571 RepID=UPI0020C55728|nr:hypothetical protein [Natrinema gelatinilyticum]